uniref:Putative secreted protein n=1 Tax=Ixodes ricinus TaxID=34613 RepID=A0A6B0UNP3_IXORI
MTPVAQRGRSVAFLVPLATLRSSFGYVLANGKFLRRKRRGRRRKRLVSSPGPNARPAFSRWIVRLLTVCPASTDYRLQVCNARALAGFVGDAPATRRQCVKGISATCGQSAGQTFILDITP